VPAKARASRFLGRRAPLRAPVEDCTVFAATTHCRPAEAARDPSVSKMKQTSLEPQMADVPFAGLSDPHAL